ncbi:hypothetical protein Q5P01_017187 [Channa striata]|uniref:Heme-binding protein 2-like n=1 Tax=Channa striata TaxID=64152 RepID=A0AA88M9K9_CHASR|nr:hypothetical protein Q5P01_017187 [Channa striata]
MAAPIIVKIPEKRFWETGTYTMSILLPAEYQRNPPKPTDNKVYISGTPDLTVYVKSYGGWVTSVSDKNTVNRLTSVLDLVGAEYIKGFHFVAGYNSPITIFNRHNEAWVVASDDPVCTSSEEWYS